tara:strand:+ start:7300 stop:8904 length:1605 start_codon:yes stop_codon:yes gene_type:complete
MMLRRRYLKDEMNQRSLLASIVFLIACYPSVRLLALDRPNIVVILADDFGVGDIQAHYPENKIKTPYLDQLVREGISFTDAHSPSAVCSPTRYGLLTGRYAWRTRMQEWVLAVYEPPLIDPDLMTLPGFLKQHGYHTACIGKWHLGWDWPGPQKPQRHPLKRNVQATLQFDFTQPIGGGPTARGFDQYFGVGLPNQPPFCWIENDRLPIHPSAEYKHIPEDGHVAMPSKFEGCPMAPGWKFDEILPEITRRAVNHIHQQAKKQSPFFLYFAQTSPHTPIVPSNKFKGQSGIAPIADFVMETDWSAGQIIKAIDDAGIADNTLVIFTADNGHAPNAAWDALVEAGHSPSGPFRGRKGDVWEGGHRVPLVARWPSKIAPGSTSNQMVCLSDMFATCADLLGASLPDGVAVDSYSFRSGLESDLDAKDIRTSMINHSNFGEFAYRKGPWKLVFKMGGEDLDASRGKPTIAELYHLGRDIAEQENVADTEPKVVEKMTSELSQWIARGASRPGQIGQNDCDVRYDTTQEYRWVEAKMN